MTYINKDLYERAFSIEIDKKSESVQRIQEQVANLIDEIVSYQPLYSTRKKIEKDPNFGIEKMKQVALWSIQKHLGDNSGQKERKRS